VNAHDDMQLLQAWRAGSKEAGTTLFRRHFSTVFLFFQSKVTVHVEDLVQRTFLACLEAGDRLDELRSFKAYLMGIARHQLLRHFTEQDVGKRRQDLLAASAEEITGSPSQVIARHDEQRVLLTALRRLPLDLQITIELFYWEQMRLVDIADVLDIPPGTVKSRLFRAKQLLREHIDAVEASDETRRSTIRNLESWARSLSADLRRDTPSEP
jgi:RNA polymerase sigma factor (sigma-70 family)